MCDGESAESEPQLCVCVCVWGLADSHEAIFSLALLQRHFDEATQLEEEQLLRRFGRRTRAFGLTVLFTQRLSTGVTCTQMFLC